MRTLIKLVSILVGLVLLAGAAVIFWFAHGPQAKEAVTTGGIAYTQQELMNVADPAELSVSVDSGATQPLSVELSDTVVADLASLSEAEAAALPELSAAPAGGPSFSAPLGGNTSSQVTITTDVVINESTAVQVAPVASGVTGLSDGQGGAMGATTEEQRVVDVEWPSEFQVGRGGAVRIKLKMLSSGALQPVAEIDDNEILATPILITDNYATHNAFVTSKLSAPDFSVQATSPLEQQLVKGGEAEWRYTLKANKSGHFVISMGLELSWIARPDNPDQTPGLQNVPIWGQNLAVDVNYVFGSITVPQASAAGTALAVVGFLAEAPLLSTVLEFSLERLLKGGERRREKEEKKRRSRRR
ncbi:MAG: hypothetical protein JXA10_15610 [Anaerolineae bacterium]|nr:hypothetical protein [Anaerolineae bacterium]